MHFRLFIHVKSTPPADLEPAIMLKCMSLDGGRTAEYPVENPRRRRENTQTPHIKAPKGPNTESAHCETDQCWIPIIDF